MRCLDDGALESLGVSTVGARIRLRMAAAEGNGAQL